MEQLKKILNEYLDQLSKDYLTAQASKNATPELSFRVALGNFLGELAKFYGNGDKIGCIHEPKKQEKYGRPDWMFFNKESMGIYGYIEAKGLNPKSRLIAKEYEDQVKRYLYLGNPVILTDGIDFLMYKRDKSTKAVSIKAVSVCSKPTNWKDIHINTDVEPFFREFFCTEGFRTISEKQLVSELSMRAKHLCTDLVDILDLEKDEAENDIELNTIIALKDLWDIASENHDKSLKDNHIFAGFVAQILSFSLLYAHRFINGKNLSSAQKYRHLDSFWTSNKYKGVRLSPFKALLHALSKELKSPFSKLGIWYDNTRRLLSCIRLSDQQVTNPNYHELYEAFLKEYDGKTRNDFGAWYTPMCLADYAVNFVHHILPVVIPGESLEEKALKIIDPCCGTGTFIESVIQKLPLYEESQIIGFEILPVPYALSNYRISMFKTPKCDIEIVLTNTLSDSTFKIVRKGAKTNNLSKLFSNEQKKANKLSKPPVTILIGNPPCSDSGNKENEGEELKKLMEDFRPPMRKGRNNSQKQLDNEMTKFLRWCVYKAEESRPSAFALILPSTFANNISFVTARKYMIEHVSEMWLLEFDKDNRAGHQAENLFNTLQGRMLLVGILKELDDSLPTLHYKSITDLSYAEKERFFNAPICLNDWNIVQLDKNFSFKPTTAVNNVLYSKFWPIASEETSATTPAIFERHCSGLKLAPTHLFIHFNEGQLRRRHKFIADGTKSYQDIIDTWYKGQKKPPTVDKLSFDVRACLSKSNLSIVNYAYRPFLTANLLLDNKLMDTLRQQKNSGMRERPEVQAAFKDNSVFGFAVAPAPADIATKLKKFTSFCWYMPDNDLATRGNSHIFCNKFPEYKNSKRNWSKKAKNNINANLLDKMSKEYNIPAGKLIAPIVFYAYAVLNSDLYLHTFEGKLYTTAGEWPSIPISKEWSLFEEMTTIGRNMADIEKIDYTSPHPTVIFNQNDFQAGIKIDSFSIKDNTIVINKVIVSEPIPQEILHFEASGYEIVKQWMKYHSYAYYNKACGKEEFEDLFNLLARIQDYLVQVREADKVMQKILKGDFITP